MKKSCAAGPAYALMNMAIPCIKKASKRRWTVSAGTAVMLDLEAYKNVPRKRVQGWGQGLTLRLIPPTFRAIASTPPIALAQLPHKFPDYAIFSWYRYPKGSENDQGRL